MPEATAVGSNAWRKSGKDSAWAGRMRRARIAAVGVNRRIVLPQNQDVIPAKAGIQTRALGRPHAFAWIPAFAGMTSRTCQAIVPESWRYRFRVIKYRSQSSAVCT